MINTDKFSSVRSLIPKTCPCNYTTKVAIYYDQIGFPTKQTDLKYREISVKIFFDLTLVAPVKIPIFTLLLPRLIARASQPDGNMTSFTLNFSRLS